MTLQCCCNLNLFCIICSQRGNDSQPIWLDDLYCGHTDKSCVGYCQTCPSHEATDCKHKEDLTVQCSKNNMITNAISMSLQLIIRQVLRTDHYAQLVMDLKVRKFYH